MLFAFGGTVFLHSPLYQPFAFMIHRLLIPFPAKHSLPSNQPAAFSGAACHLAANPSAGQHQQNISLTYSDKMQENETDYAKQNIKI